MVIRKLRLQRSTFWSLGVLLFILAADIAAIRSFPKGGYESILVYAFLIDFMLVVPFLYWLLFMRRRGKPIKKALLLPLFGAVAAWFVLPAQRRHLVTDVAWWIELAIFALELAVLYAEARLVIKLVRAFRQARRERPDTAEALRVAVHGGIGRGRMPSFALHDATLLYYLLFSWRRKRPVADGVMTFSYHKETHQALYCGIFTKIIALEGIFTHLVVADLTTAWLAWIVTVGDLWLLALIWGDYRASVLQPVKLAGDVLTIRYGMRIQSDIPMSRIAEVSVAREYRVYDKEHGTKATPVLGTANVRIKLMEPTRAEGLLFQPRAVDVVYLALDDPHAFKKACDSAVPSA
ncbi:hypothetical protein ACFPPD_01845 [Cohnella suwonensis]|uniref:Uncharacterized protein n=1 Tax=Cohnella suwonensis TaxID=696072 RepID=A0ABW0LR56_9BACL